MKNNSHYHHLFSSDEGDVTLASKNGDVHFRIYSFVLKTASGWFRTMFSLPQKYESAEPHVIYMDEDADILESLLRMTSGMEIVPPRSYAEVDALLYAAEKYDMPGPMSIIRALVMTPPLRNDILRLYAVATRFGWQAEAQYASTESLTLNLYAEEHRPALQNLSASPLLDLFKLHRGRRDALRLRMEEPPFVSGDTAVCIECGVEVRYSTWRELKNKIIWEMDIRPLGDTVTAIGLLEWEEADACWAAKCRGVNCGRALYDKAETIRVIKECIEDLKKSI